MTELTFAPGESQYRADNLAKGSGCGGGEVALV